ncbi:MULTISPECIES: nitroreductase family deazaflavin-dependent oxidoreductase [unclassified Nocardioides]|uniref:nitroreductase family deazaflavin-dependent oxidoreductase n=1 Tax=unclassified Nocardioides TaxID=2615069 RepID=UPI0000EB60B2|nr:MULTISPECIES: nitroreductase family deazaflavin-dependent oxidoreductase [unclassified Nocardioides]ABL79717.1 Mycobacterium tuberculosis paralogous family 11 [Nocardioides sp. JS614]
MNPLRWLALRLGAQPWLPRFARVIVTLDLTTQRLSRGRVDLLTFAGLPELLLQVPGRRTGVLRSTPLLCVPHGDGWLVAGSNWGAPTPPAWVANVLGADEPLVTFRGHTVAADALLLTGPDRDEAWAVMTGTWPNYAKYAERTGRELPVILLTPR